jgi:hypothetical protein
MAPKGAGINPPRGRWAAQCGGFDTDFGGAAYSLRLPAVMPSM